MTAGHFPAPRMRRRRAAIGLCFSIIYILSVDSVQVPTYRQPQEPDEAPYDTDYDASRNDTITTPVAATRGGAPRIPQDFNDYEEFMTWCTQVLGIQTSLEIKDFAYPDFMRIRMAADDDDDELCDEDTVEEEPVVTVRGLAASHDIQEGVSMGDV